MDSTINDIRYIRDAIVRNLDALRFMPGVLLRVKYDDGVVAMDARVGMESNIYTIEAKPSLGGYIPASTLVYALDLSPTELGIVVKTNLIRIDLLRVEKVLLRFREDSHILYMRRDDE